MLFIFSRQFDDFVRTTYFEWTLYEHPFIVLGAKFNPNKTTSAELSYRSLQRRPSNRRIQLGLHYITLHYITFELFRVV